VDEYLQVGRLVRPFAHELKGNYQYYLVCPEAAAARPAIAAFRAWLLDEAAAQGAKAL
jgi:LysR family transcriptional regulator, glycine cleavage system transcriptional activator